VQEEGLSVTKSQIAALLFFGCLTFSGCKQKKSNVRWTDYESTMCKLRYPAGWRIKEAPGDPTEGLITINTPRGSEDNVGVMIIQRAPGKGDLDIDHLAKESVARSLNREGIVIEKIKFKGVDARRFMEYLAAPFIDAPQADGSRAATAGLYPQETIVFVMNGRLYELSSDIPEKNPDFYRSIFHEIADSIEFKDGPTEAPTKQPKK
jgi:hypothetical protein